MGFSGDTSLRGENDITRMETNVFSHSDHAAFNSTLGETAGFTGVNCTPLGYVLLKCVLYVCISVAGKSRRSEHTLQFYYIALDLPFKTYLFSKSDIKHPPLPSTCIYLINI